VTTAKTNEKVDDRLLVDIPGAAKRLSVSPRSIQNLIYSGELPSLLVGPVRRSADGEVRPGRARRIEVGALVAYVERLRQEQQT
jgi:hypothetical protein